MRHVAHRVPHYVFRRIAQGLAASAALWLILIAPAEAATGSSFGVAEVVGEVQRQLAAADQGDAVLQIDEASLDLSLIEGLGVRNGGLAVPGADYIPGSKDGGGGRPALRQRMVLDLSADKRTKPAANGTAGAGQLTRAILDVKAAVQQAMAADAGFDLKKLSLDFDFAMERDSKGQPALKIQARDQRIDTAGVQGVKVRFAAKSK